MTPTPHPADALPLPEKTLLARDTYTEVEAWGYEDQDIRAAHREGFELAMSKTGCETAFVDAKSAEDWRLAVAVARDVPTTGKAVLNASTVIQINGELQFHRAKAEQKQEAFSKESDDADELLCLLGLDPDSCRTDGGFINMPRVRSLLKDREPYGVLSELFECFDLPYPPETAGRDAQSAWGDRRAAAKEQARAILALKATAGGVA